MAQPRRSDLRFAFRRIPPGEGRHPERDQHRRFRPAISLSLPHRLAARRRFRGRPRYRFLGGPLDRPVSRSSRSFPSFELFRRKLQARSSFGARTRPVIRITAQRDRGPVTPPRTLFECSYELLSHSIARLRPENHAVGKIAGPSMTSLPPSSTVSGKPAGASKANFRTPAEP